MTATYQQLSSEEVDNLCSEVENDLVHHLNSSYNPLSVAERTYFDRALKLKHRIPQFYATMKIHKSPFSTRPVVSCVGSFNEVFSKWLDYSMKKFTSISSSYIKDSQDLLHRIKKLKTLPINARLFTSDAVSMYTNIDTNVGIQTFRNIFEDFNAQIPEDVPQELFIKVLKIIMKNNVFAYGDTVWLQ